MARAVVEHVPAPLGRRSLLSEASLAVAGLCASSALAAPRPACADPLQQLDDASNTTLPVGAPAAAEVQTAGAPPNSSSARQVYLDVKLEGTLLGRIVVELDSSLAPVGAARFADLAQEKEGVGYRLSKFDGIFQA